MEPQKRQLIGRGGDLLDRGVPAKHLRKRVRLSPQVDERQFPEQVGPVVERPPQLFRLVAPLLRELLFFRLAVVEPQVLFKLPDQIERPLRVLLGPEELDGAEFLFFPTVVEQRQLGDLPAAEAQKRPVHPIERIGREAVGVRLALLLGGAFSRLGRKIDRHHPIAPVGKNVPQIAHRRAFRRLAADNHLRQHRVVFP